MSKFIALVEIEQVVKGARVYVQPGKVVNLPNNTSAEKKEVDFFKARKAVRDLTASEEELEGLRAASKKDDEDGEGDGTDARTPEQVAEEAAALAETDKAASKGKSHTAPTTKAAAAAAAAAAASQAGNGKVKTQEEIDADAAAGKEAERRAALTQAERDEEDKAAAIRNADSDI